MLRKILDKKNRLDRKQGGFTIIEVLIVLAIAGLIMVVVLIAIPQLQRNQRNSARTADIARLGTAIQNWVTNNNGAVITSGTAAQVTTNTNAVISDTGATLNQYVLTAGSTLILAPIAATAQTNTTLANIVVLTGAGCGLNGVATSTGNARTFAILYAEENSTSAAGQGVQTCIAF